MNLERVVHEAQEARKRHEAQEASSFFSLHAQTSFHAEGPAFKSRDRRHAQTTDANVCKKKKNVRVGAGQYLKWIEGFTTKKKSFGITLIPVTVSQ
jgi:hypothetical protein